MTATNSHVGSKRCRLLRGKKNANTKDQNALETGLLRARSLWKKATADITIVINYISQSVVNY